MLLAWVNGSPSQCHVSSLQSLLDHSSPQNQGWSQFSLHSIFILPATGSGCSSALFAQSIPYSPSSASVIEWFSHGVPCTAHCCAWYISQIPLICNTVVRVEFCSMYPLELSAHNIPYPLLFDPLASMWLCSMVPLVWLNGRQTMHCSQFSLRCISPNTQV